VWKVLEGRDDRGRCLQYKQTSPHHSSLSFQRTKSKRNGIIRSYNLISCKQTGHQNPPFRICPHSSGKHGSSKPSHPSQVIPRSTQINPYHSTHTRSSQHSNNPIKTQNHYYNTPHYPSTSHPAPSFPKPYPSSGTAPSAAVSPAYPPNPGPDPGPASTATTAPHPAHDGLCTPSRYYRHITRPRR